MTAGEGRGESDVILELTHEMSKERDTLNVTPGETYKLMYFKDEKAILFRLTDPSGEDAADKSVCMLI